MSSASPIPRSAELRSIAARYWAAIRRGDVEAVIARHSAAPGITAIGTDPTEFIDDHARLMGYLRDQFSSVVDWTGTDGDVDAWVEEAKRAGARSLITTAKDAVKLRSFSFALPCYFLEIQISIEEEDQLLEMIREAVRHALLSRNRTAH